MSLQEDTQCPAIGTTNVLVTGRCGLQPPEDGTFTYVDKPVEETHWEVGCGIGRLFAFLRLDFAWRLTSRQGRVFVISIGGGF